MKLPDTARNPACPSKQSPNVGLAVKIPNEAVLLTKQNLSVCLFSPPLDTTHHFLYIENMMNVTLFSANLNSMPSCCCAFEALRFREGMNQ